MKIKNGPLFRDLSGNIPQALWPAVAEIWNSPAFPDVPYWVTPAVVAVQALAAVSLVAGAFGFALPVAHAGNFTMWVLCIFSLVVGWQTFGKVVEANRIEAKDLLSTGDKNFLLSPGFLSLAFDSRGRWFRTANNVVGVTSILAAAAYLAPLLATCLFLAELVMLVSRQLALPLAQNYLALLADAETKAEAPKS
jgi:hypothetical protein